MANRISGNVVIIDSAMGNKIALQDVSGGNQITKLMINAWCFLSTGSNGSLLLTGTNTADDILFVHNAGGSLTNEYNPKWNTFAQAQPIENLKAPVVTSGTVLLYFV